MRLSSARLLLAVYASVYGIPFAFPESVRASGDCSELEVEIMTTEQQRQGLYLILGVRSGRVDAREVDKVSTLLRFVLSVSATFPYILCRA